MSAAAYSVTRQVRHLAAWTRDVSVPGERWAMGHWRPICGAKVAPPSDVMWIGFEYENHRKVAFAMSRPVCKRCAEVLAALNEAVQ